MQKVELTYSACGTSALKARPCDKHHDAARIIAFPSHIDARRGKSSLDVSAGMASQEVICRKGEPVKKLTRLQSSLATAFGIAFAFVILFV